MKAEHSFYKLKYEAEFLNKPLPENVNQWVKEFLAKRGYEDLAIAIDKKAESIQYGSLECVNALYPDRTIKVDTQCGMVTGFDIITERKVGTSIIKDKTHVLNPKLDMSKERGKKK